MSHTDAASHIISPDMYAQLAGKLIDTLRPNPADPSARAVDPGVEKQAAAARAAATATLPPGGSGRVSVWVGPPNGVTVSVLRHLCCCVVYAAR